MDIYYTFVCVRRANSSRYPQIRGCFESSLFAVEYKKERVGGRKCHAKTMVNRVGEAAARTKKTRQWHEGTSGEVKVPKQTITQTLHRTPL